MSVFKAYPESTGSVHITSGEDAKAPLDFDPAYCSKYVLRLLVSVVLMNILPRPGDVAQLVMFYSR